MSVGGIDTGEEEVTNQTGYGLNAPFDTDDASQYPDLGLQEIPGQGSGTPLAGWQSSGVTITDPVKRAEEQHKTKMNSILNGNHTQASLAAGDLGGRSVFDPAPKKDEPWIGPDGGMIGRGIKSAGDWYQDYINGKRDTIMNTMEHELNRTFNDQFIDGLNTWAHAATTTLTGFDTGYEPKYGANRILQAGAMFPTSLSGVLPRGFGVGQSLLVPLPALVQGANWMGGGQVTPEAATRATASLVQTGANAVFGMATPKALQARELIEKSVEAGMETDKALRSGKY